MKSRIQSKHIMKTNVKNCWRSAIKKAIVEQDLWVEPGAEVKAFTAANRAFGTLILRSENENRLQEVMKDPSRFIKVKLKK